jgi:ribosomal protein S18 acetylase RimI-like enzyme
MEIRPATAEDGRYVRRLVFDILNEYSVPADPDDSDHDVMEFGEDQNPRTSYFVAESRGAIVGCVIVMPTHEKSGKLSKLFVHPQHRRRGIGRKLMHQALRAAADQGYDQLVIHTRARYREAVSLYESSGWQRGPDSPGPGPERSYSYTLLQRTGGRSSARNAIGKADEVVG